MRDIYYIWYDNGERWDDHWSGIMEGAGFYLDINKAQAKLLELRELSNKRIREELDNGYMYPSGEHETFEIKKSTLIE